MRHSHEVMVEVSLIKVASLWGGVGVGGVKTEVAVSAGIDYIDFRRH